MKIPAAFGLLLISATGALAQDVEAGRMLARTWCAGCHNVSPGVTAMKEGAAPPFQLVANSKGMTQTALTAFLMTNHGRMPDYSLTRKEISDVSAYILSLKN
jgi:mono/diheme cytochrome c family protein